MIKKGKSIFSLILIGILMCISIPTNAGTESEEMNKQIHESKITMENKYGKNVDVFFANEDTGATYDDVKKIIDDDPEAVSYTVYEVSGEEENEQSYEKENDKLPVFQARTWNPPLFSTHKYKTTKKVTVPSRVVRDDFVISVAKGQTVTLKKKYSGKLTGSIEGKSFKQSKLGIKMSVECEFSTTHKFTGPTSGKANSREYRVKYFREDGEYIQHDYCYKMDGSLYGIRSRGGTYKSPVKYASYSKDYKH